VAAGVADLGIAVAVVLVAAADVADPAVVAAVAAVELVAAADAADPAVVAAAVAVELVAAADVADPAVAAVAAAAERDVRPGAAALAALATVYLSAYQTCLALAYPERTLEQSPPKTKTPAPC
jgi:hypothetical protein